MRRLSSASMAATTCRPIVCRDAAVQAKVKRKVRAISQLRVLMDRGIMKIRKVSDYLGQKKQDKEESRDLAQPT